MKKRSNQLNLMNINKTPIKNQRCNLKSLSLLTMTLKNMLVNVIAINQYHLKVIIIKLLIKVLICY
mgnify:CR=1 FL=1